MIQDIGRNLFYGFLTELIFCIIAYFVQDNKRKIYTLLIGTIIAFVIGFGFQMVVASDGSSRIILSLQGNTYHLGDEQIDQWPPLNGECINGDFTIVSSITPIAIEMETLGSESPNLVSINEKVNYQMPSNQGNPTYRPNKNWITQRFVVSSNNLMLGLNRIQICSVKIEHPDNNNDIIDDFLIRNIRMMSIENSSNP